MKSFNKNDLITIIALVAITHPNQNTISTDFSLKMHAEATVDLTIENANKPAPQLKPTPKNPPKNRRKNNGFRRANNSIK